MGSTGHDANGTLGPSNVSVAQSLSSAFQSGDLTTSDFQSVPIYADTISGCFQSIYINVKMFSFADNGMVPEACTRQDLFPIEGSENSLNDCVKAICSPLTMDPDLAGIGVSPT